MEENKRAGIRGAKRTKSSVKPREHRDGRRQESDQWIEI